MENYNYYVSHGGKLPIKNIVKGRKINKNLLTFMAYQSYFNKSKSKVKLSFSQFKKKLLTLKKFSFT